MNNVMPDINIYKDNSLSKILQKSWKKYSPNLLYKPLV